MDESQDLEFRVEVDPKSMARSALDYFNEYIPKKGPLLRVSLIENLIFPDSKINVAFVHAGESNPEHVELTVQMSKESILREGVCNKRLIIVKAAEDAVNYRAVRDSARPYSAVYDQLHDHGIDYRTILLNEEIKMPGFLQTIINSFGAKAILSSSEDLDKNIQQLLTSMGPGQLLRHNEQ